MAFHPSFANVPTDATRNFITYVETINGLPDPVAGVITLDDEVRYVITQPLNLGTNQIKVDGGNQCAIVSSNEIKNTLTTALTGNSPLFIGDVGRLVIQDLDIISSTGTSNLYNVLSVTAARPAVIQQRSLVSGFASLGIISGATFIGTNIAFSSNGAGLTLNNNGSGLGSGIIIDDINFIDQSGNHLIFTGSADFLSASGVIAAPSTGDVVYDVSGLTLGSVADIGNTLFDGLNGGTLGLTQSITTSTTLANIYNAVSVNTTSGAVTITLPNTLVYLLPDGFRINIKDSGNAATNNITIIPNGSDSTTINNGLVAYYITEDDGSVLLEKQGATWEIINRVNQKSRGVVSSTSTLTEIYDILIGDTTGGTFTTTLPTAVGRKGKFIVLKKKYGSTPSWTVTGNGSETIDTNANLILTGVNGPGATLASDGANWEIIEER